MYLLPEQPNNGRLGARRRGSLHFYTPISLVPFVSRLFSPHQQAVVQVQSNQRWSQIVAQRAVNRGVAGLRLAKMDSHSESAHKLPLEPSSGKRSRRQNFILYILVLFRTAGSKSIAREPDLSTPPLLAAFKSPAADARTLSPSDSGPGVCFIPWMKRLSAAIQSGASSEEGVEGGDGWPQV